MIENSKNKIQEGYSKSSIFISAGIVAYPALIYANTWQIFAIIYGVCGFFDGGYGAAGNALAMDVCNPKIGTTQYSIMCSVANFGTFGTELSVVL